MEILIAGAPARQALDKIRADRAAAEAELEQLACAVLPLDDTVARILQGLKLPRERAEEYLLAYARPGASPSPPEQAAVGLFAWLDPKAFEAQLRKRLKEVLPAPGPEAGARPVAIAKLKARLAELDESEEQETSRLEAEDFVVDRRADADLATLLRLWDRDVAA